LRRADPSGEPASIHKYSAAVQATVGPNAALQAHAPQQGGWRFAQSTLRFLSTQR